ncbi:MAG: NADH-quinone oxidoreductase subunit N, partial [Candidatus Methanomethylophilaceae archaeon]
DVYEGASTPITMFLATGSKKMGFVALIKVFLVCFVLGQAVMVSEIQLAFAVLAALTMTVGNVVAISQTNIKRMLAYSSISQAGYLMIMLAVGTEYALVGGLFHMITHVFMKGGAFIVVAALSYGALGEHLNDYKGLAKRAPFVAFAMMLFLFSLAGIPPLAGFVSKFVLFSSAISEPGAPASMQWVWLVLVAVVNSAISLYYYARVVKFMYVEEGESKEPISLPKAYSLAIAICALAVVVIGLYPEPVISACELAAAALLS